MNQKIVIIGGVVVLLASGILVYAMFVKQPKDLTVQSNNQQLTNPMPVAQTQTAQLTGQELLWQQSEDGWQAMGISPDCPAQPMMTTPTDLSLATAVLYPGQTRGGNYKPHGGLRFDGSNNDDIAVKATADGYLVRGSRYLEMGEVQYVFDVMHNCGVMYRFDHLRVLPAKIQTIADTFPDATDGDSRTHSINPPVAVNQGETLATSVGFLNTKNVGFDWGVYDFRQENEASASAVFRSAHAHDKELSWHAVCWFDWLSVADESTVRSLPAGDSVSGKTSDYCTQ